MQDLVNFVWDHPALLTGVGVFLVILAAVIVGLIARFVLVRLVNRLISDLSFVKGTDFVKAGIITRLANAAPAMVISSWVSEVPGLPLPVVTVVRNVADSFIVFVVAIAIGSVLQLLGSLWQKRHSDSGRSIKGFVQVACILVYIVAAVLIVAIIVNRSPLILLSSLGALTAVLLLVFQDTLLSLVAAIELSTTDIVRVGDWIEMPSMNADGDVIDMSLYSVTVRNWDNTYSTFPVRNMVSQPFKNWRGMTQSGARRIMRSIPVDQSTVHFIDEECIDKLSQLRHLTDFITQEKQKCEDWNARLGASAQVPGNRRRMTNIGLFRAYAVNYLKSRPDIRKDLTLMVRHEPPGPNGLPIEVYCFTNTTEWITYEMIQADIIDHLLAMMDDFDLKVFQAS